MGKMTVSVPEDLIKRLRLKHPEINWAEVVRAAIIKRLEKLEELKERGEF
ncbi:MAG: hypothetical protein V1837_04775 [Candidatus Woesearchaeota archaeon]